MSLYVKIFQNPSFRSRNTVHSVSNKKVHQFVCQNGPRTVRDVVPNMVTVTFSGNVGPCVTLTDNCYLIWQLLPEKVTLNNVTILGTTSRTDGGAPAGKFIDIDGSVMEGGGQILRLSSCLSAILNEPIHIHNIRGGRKNPGLRPQHLNGLYLLSDMTQGKLKGARKDSTEIWFSPGKLTNGSFSADTRTAGSITLLLQSALPCLVMSPGQQNKLNLRGGTNVAWSPQLEFCTYVLKPYLERFCGFSFESLCKRKGFFPRGGGEVSIEIAADLNTGFMFKSFDLLERGEITEIRGYSWVAGTYGIEFAQEMTKAAEEIIQSEHPNVSILIENVKEESAHSAGDGCGIIIYANTSNECIIAGDALGDKSSPADVLGKAAGEMLLNNLKHGGCVDQHMQDQLVIFALLASGTSRIRSGPLTLHTETAIHIAKLMTKAKISTQNQNDGTVIIEIEGLACKKL